MSWSGPFPAGLGWVPLTLRWSHEGEPGSARCWVSSSALARGSEVGNSQAGKRRGSTGGLRTRDSEPDSWGAGGQRQGLGLREAGV